MVEIGNSLRSLIIKISLYQSLMVFWKILRLHVLIQNSHSSRYWREYFKSSGSVQENFNNLWFHKIALKLSVDIHERSKHHRGGLKLIKFNKNEGFSSLSLEFAPFWLIRLGWNRNIYNSRLLADLFFYFLKPWKYFNLDYCS